MPRGGRGDAPELFRRRGAPGASFWMSAAPAGPRHERLADVADAEILGRAGGCAAEGAAAAESVEVDPQGMVAKKTSSESTASSSAAIDDTNHPLGVVCVAA